MCLLSIRGQCQDYFRETVGVELQATRPLGIVVGQLLAILEEIAILLRRRCIASLNTWNE